MDPMWTIVDDQSPELTLSPAWQVGQLPGPVGNTEGIVNNTLTFLNSPGSFAFTFSGDVSFNINTYTYVLIWFWSIYSNIDVSATENHWLFCGVHELSRRHSHTFTIEVNASISRPFWFDHIQYVKTTPMQGPGQTSTHPLTPIPSSSDVHSQPITPDSSMSSIPLPISTGQPKLSNSVQTGVVVGAVIGGLCIIAALSSICLCIARRRQRSGRSESVLSSVVSQYPIPLFIEGPGDQADLVAQGKRRAEIVNVTMLSRNNAVRKVRIPLHSRGVYHQVHSNTHGLAGEESNSETPAILDVRVAIADPLDANQQALQDGLRQNTPEERATGALPPPYTDIL
ncbi:hypothetical protein CVT24_012303 [Panaeolus cyanescens]|uniref:Mid2 domain-containing protein n=1 Tax=Panaeolus cyanescens TaxID=181874 RepID=A0A409W493_9AGAR|nr:hypothetical protein CVT24_012303 [Panaeolus cyanescens]